MPYHYMHSRCPNAACDSYNTKTTGYSETEGTVLEHGAPREQGHYGFMLTDLYLLGFIIITYPLVTF